MVKISNRVNNLRTEVDKLDAGKMKNITKDFKTLSDVVDKEIVEKTGYNPINTKVNKLEKKRSWCLYFNSSKSIPQLENSWKTQKKIENVKKKFLKSLV